MRDCGNVTHSSYTIHNTYIIKHVENSLHLVLSQATLCVSSFLYLVTIKTNKHNIDVVLNNHKHRINISNKNYCIFGIKFIAAHDYRKIIVSL